LGRSTLIVVAALLAAPPARAGAGEVRAEAALHLRVTSLSRLPSTQVLFDPATRLFATDGYLVPEGRERYGSLLASVRLDGRHLGGDLAWTLALDTGELRRRRLPEPVLLCRAPLTSSPSGLGVVGRDACTPGGAATALVESTVPGGDVATANGRLLGDEVERTLLVREAFAAWRFGRAGLATLRGGRSRQAVADGLVHDDYATGVDLRVDLGAVGPPFEVGLALYQPTRDLPGTVDGISPLLLVRADWLPSLFERAGLFLAVHRDRTGGVAELFRGAIIESAAVALSGLTPGTIAYADASRLLAATLDAPLQSDATLAWVGTSGSLLPWKGQRLSWTAALLGGRIDRLGVAQGETLVDIPLRGAAARLRWEVGLTDRLTVAVTGLYLSGDRPPTEKRRLGLPPGYDGFLGVTPWITETGLFFGGGLSESFAARQASAPGVNGRGVLAPVLELSADLPGAVDLSVRGAWLVAEDAGPFGGRVYGTEADLVARWEPAPWLALGLEADVLFPGDFFGGREPVSRLVLAVDARTP
jgi:hypothetical protein